jgi:hypothetical protein
MVALVFLILLFFVFLGTNLSWYFHSERKEKEHERVCRVYDRVIEARDKDIENLQSKSILFDKTIIPVGMTEEEFIEKVRLGEPVGVALGGRSIEDCIAYINKSFIK